MITAEELDELTEDCGLRDQESPSIVLPIELVLRLVRAARARQAEGWSYDLNAAPDGDSLWAFVDLADNERWIMQDSKESVLQVNAQTAMPAYAWRSMFPPPPQDKEGGTRA